MARILPDWLSPRRTPHIHRLIVLWPSCGFFVLYTSWLGVLVLQYIEIHGIVIEICCIEIEIYDVEIEIPCIEIELYCIEIEVYCMEITI